MFYRNEKECQHIVFLLCLNSMSIYTCSFYLGIEIDIRWVPFSKFPTTRREFRTNVFGKKKKNSLGTMKRNTKDVKIQCPRDTLVELLRAGCIFVEFVISARAAICLLYTIVLIVFRSVGGRFKRISKQYRRWLPTLYQTWYFYSVQC